jgi:hypothetical protein
LCLKWTGPRTTLEQLNMYSRTIPSGLSFWHMVGLIYLLLRVHDYT